MSTYKGWSIKLKNGGFVNDSEGAIGPMLFATRREARAVWEHIPESEPCKVVRVTVTVKECKP